VRRLLADGALRAELAARAHDRARRLFTKRAMVERTLATYGLSEAVSKLLQRVDRSVQTDARETRAS
jgi:hypothetical protein